MANLCQCGCGKKAPLAKRTRPELGHIKGKPIKFISGHNLLREHNPRWNNGIQGHTAGYVKIYKPSHHRADANGYVFEHILVIEGALGKRFPDKATTHHVDGNMGNNKNNNLILCENHAYHKLLHVRERALQDCGNANLRKCNICKKYDEPNNLIFDKTYHVFHKTCKYNRYKEKGYGRKSASN